MVTLEYKFTKIQVPEGWQDITLRQYEALGLRASALKTARDRVDYVSAVCGVDRDLLLSWPSGIFNRIVGYIRFLWDNNPAKPLNYITIDGVKWVIAIDSQLTLGEWVDVEEAQKAEKDVLSNVLSIVCRPASEEYDCKNNEARQELFASLPMSRVLPLFAFFLCCKTALDSRTEAFTKISELIAPLRGSTGSLRSRGGGIKLSQTWRTIRLMVLMQLLNYRLYKYSRTYCIDGIKESRKNLSAR